MSFGYSQIAGTSINSYSQVRRSADMIYQRGNTYNINLTGDTYVQSMELSVDLYADDVKVGNMSVVPFDVTESASVYTYRFNVRPYDYLSNYINSATCPTV